jgi:hypothetical protein
MNHSTASSAGTITGPPYVTLVDIDGYAVPSCEKDIPDPPTFESAEEWGAWADCYRYELGAAWADGPDAPDADPRIAFPGIASLAERLSIPPVSGGAPYEPDERDLADYGRWSEELDRRRDAFDYLTRFNAERQDWTERPA